MFERVLFLGTGPTSVQLALLFKKKFKNHVGIAGRGSSRSNSFMKSLESSHGEAKVTIQNRMHSFAEGSVRFDKLFQEYHLIEGEWDTLVLTVPANAYIDLLQKFPVSILKGTRRVILVSPTFGSNQMIYNYLKKINENVEVLSFSTYIGDTRWIDGVPSTVVLTTAIKKKISIGSTICTSESMELLRQMLHRLGSELEIRSSPLEAEIKNISLYVHPALFMNSFSLDMIFGDTSEKKYVYKLFPEGPITQKLIRKMLFFWKEMMEIVDCFHIERINLLKFMIDDNYPLREESIDRSDIENFEMLDPIHQEYLLYVRYSSLLIDPFSQPDEDGAYFDFSKVPFRKVFINESNQVDIPRMPNEDYYRTKMIQAIAKSLKVDCPTIDELIHTYEMRLLHFAEHNDSQRLSPAFDIRNVRLEMQLLNMTTSKENTNE